MTWMGYPYPCITLLTSDDLLLWLSHMPLDGLVNLLLISIVFTAFHALMRLSEITQLDDMQQCLLRKVTLWHTVALMPTTFLLTLPSHKTDCFCHGSTIVVEVGVPPLDPHHHFI